MENKNLSKLTPDELGEIAGGENPIEQHKPMPLYGVTDDKIMLKYAVPRPIKPHKPLNPGEIPPIDDKDKEKDKNKQQEEGINRER